MIARHRPERSEAQSRDGGKAIFGKLASALLFCSLAVLSHPEAGLLTAGLCAILWLFFGRTWRGLLDASLLALGVPLLTAPWWGTVLAYHGLAPFLSALQTGQHASADWLSLLFSLPCTDEFIPLLLILRLAGFVYAIWKKEYFHLVLIFASVILDPRSADSLAFLSFSMLAALGFLDVVPAVFRKLRRIETGPVLTYRAGAAALCLLAFTLFVECGLLNFRLVNTTLTADERAAMQRVRTHLPPNQDFLLITGRTYSMSDPVQEWFPTLTGQRSQSTLQGLEWTLGARFEPRLNELVELQSCLDLACVEMWSNRTRLEFDYLWVSKVNEDRSSDVARSMRRLLEELKTSARYRLIYESDGAAIYRKVD